MYVSLKCVIRLNKESEKLKLCHRGKIQKTHKKEKIIIISDVVTFEDLSSIFSDWIITDQVKPKIKGSGERDKENCTQKPDQKTIFKR